MDETAYLEELARKPLTSRIVGYIRLSGPGYMQSAMTLGSGTIASTVLMGSLLGYRLLWVQPLAMFLGYFVLAAVAKQTTYTGERPYKAFWEHLHPVWAILWAVSAMTATVLWHIPQYTVTVNGIATLVYGFGYDIAQITRVVHLTERAVYEIRIVQLFVGFIVLTAAIGVVSLYYSGARGLRLYELAIKILVWGIVLAFAVVALSSGMRWRELFLGVTGIAFVRDLIGGHALEMEPALLPIIGGMAAAVGINMLFLYPYTILKRGWGKPHKELAYFDLLSGMVVPFLLAVAFIQVGTANTLGPRDGQIVAEGIRDARDLVPALGSTFGVVPARLLIGFGLAAIGFSTIITHMLAAGFIGCEMFGVSHESKLKWLFTLLPAVGVIGSVSAFPWWAAITASTLAFPLMPVAVVCFLVLLNRRNYMGDEVPRSGYRVLWNGILGFAVILMTVAATVGVVKNWKDLQNALNPPEVVATTVGPVETSTPTPSPVAETTTPAPAAPEVAEESGLYDTYTHRAMGTEFAFTVYARPGDEGTDEVESVAQEAFAAVDALESQISNWQPDSNITYVNNHAHEKPVRASGDVLDLILYSQEIHARTQGTFDVTVGPLLDLWGFYKKEGHLPSEAELSATLQLVGSDKVEINRDDKTVYYKVSGMKIDFGGIGKGSALDRAAAVLKQFGIASAVLHGGTSTVVAIGAPPGEPGWTVRIRDPYNEEESIGEVVLRDNSVSTSGGYDNFFVLDGKTYCHIFDPRTGMPVDGMLSATAIAPTGTESDALSTSFFVLGLEGTRQYCDGHPGVGALLAPYAPRGELKIERINAAE